jgi:hypothetical protein
VPAIDQAWPSRTIVNPARTATRYGLDQSVRTRLLGEQDQDDPAAADGDDGDQALVSPMPPIVGEDPHSSSVATRSASSLIAKMSERSATATTVALPVIEHACRTGGRRSRHESP